MATLMARKKPKAFLDQSGVDALMIGRGSIGRPWIFKEVKHYLQTGEMLTSANGGRSGPKCTRPARNHVH